MKLAFSLFAEMKKYQIRPNLVRAFNLTMFWLSFTFSI